MRKLVPIAAVLVCACSGRVKDGGLIADIRLATGVRASCVDVRVKDTSDTELGATRVPVGTKRELEVAIGSHGYPRDVVVTAQPLFGPDGCSMTARPNGPVVEKPATFPSGSIERVYLDVNAPPMTLDGDGDGFVGTANGGPDCNDADPNAFPTAMEDCTSVADLDCDGLGGCADMKCMSRPDCAQPADRLAFSSPPRTVDLGACSAALDIETRNATGPALVPGGTVVSVSPMPAAGVQLFTDSACTMAASSITATVPKGVFTFYLSSSSTLGSVELTASSGTLTPATQAVTVRAPAPSQLVFASNPQSVAAGACTATMLEVEAQDASGTARAVAADTPVTLAVTPLAAVQFYSDTGCATGATAVTMTAGQSRARFWVRGLTAGAPVVSATAAGLGVATQAVTVSAGPAARLKFVTAGQGVPVSSCSNVVQVRAEDAQGNPAALSTGITVDLTTTGVPVTLHADVAACNAATPTIASVALAAPSGSVASFFFKGGATMGNADVRAGVAGNSLTADTQTENIGVGPPHHLAFTTPVRDVQAGACSAAVTVQLQDSANNSRNPITPVMVTLTGNPTAGFTLYSDASCANAVSGPLVLSSSPSGTFYFKAQKTPTQAITASASGLSPDPSQTHNISAAGADRLVITTGAQNITAGMCSSAIHVDVQDQFMNLVSVTNLPLTFTSTASNYAFHGAGGCATPAPASIASGSGTDFTVTGNTVGALAIRVSSGSLTAANQTETVAAGMASALQFDTTSRMQAAGICTATASPLMLSTRDSVGNAVTVPGGLAIDLSNDAGFRFYAGTPCSTPVSQVMVPANGGQVSFWFDGQLVGTTPIVASASTFTSAVQNQTINPNDPKQLFIVSPAQVTLVGQCSPAQVQIQSRDQYGNVSPLTSGALSISVDGGTALQIYDAAACSSPPVPAVTMLNSSATAQFWYRGTVAGSPVVSISASGFSGDSQAETVNAGTTRVKLLGSPQTLQAGACSAAVTVEAQDGAGAAFTQTSPLQVDLTAANGLTYYSDAACTTPVTFVTIGATFSSTPFYFRGVTGGAGSLGVTSTGLTGDTQAFTIVPAVRTGSCQLASGVSTVMCPLGYTLAGRDKTFLVFQNAPAAGTVNTADTLLRCHLADSANVVCQRGAADNSVDTAYWQTATFPTAVTVTHISDAGCQGDTTNVAVPSVGSTADVFVLHSMSATGTGHVDNDELDTVRLTSATQVQLQHSVNACGVAPTHDLQLVKWTGAQVTRGNGQSYTNQAVVTDTGPAVAGDRTFLLYSWRTTSSGADPCERDVRGSLPDAGVIQFSRANGSGQATCFDNTIDDLAWERAELPVGNRVQQVNVTIAAGQLSAVANIVPVDPTRSLVMSGSNTSGGSSRGETNDDNTNDEPDSLFARFTLFDGGTQVSAIRTDNDDAMRYTVFVIELDPR